LTAYSENNSSLVKILKLFITDDILNEICHHTNAEGSSRIPKMWKDISSEELLAFLGLCIVSGILKTRREPLAKLWTKKHCLCQTDFSVQQWQGIGSFKFFVSFVSMTKLQ